MRTIKEEEPIIKNRTLKGGFKYSDAYLIDNDARFVFNFIHKSLIFGAKVVNYVKALESRLQANDLQPIWHISVEENLKKERFEIRSKMIINAADPFVDEINQKNEIPTKKRHVFSKGVHLVVKKIARQDKVLTFFDDRDRLFFVIPMGPRSVIGTTDTKADSPHSEVLQEDIEF